VWDVAGCGAARAVLQISHRCKSSARDTDGPTWMGDLNFMTQLSFVFSTTRASTVGASSETCGMATRRRFLGRPTALDDA
jgi:hypothetical protein